MERTTDKQKHCNMEKNMLQNADKMQTANRKLNRK